MTKIDIAIPVLDEQEHIEKCLSSVINFDIPSDCEINIYVLDGGSKDKTLEILKRLSNKVENIHLLHNKKRIQSSALNIAIREGSGQYLLRLDAHSYYPKNYLSLSFETLLEKKAHNVGGMAITEPGSNSYEASIVQALTTHIFGVGNSGFRIGAEEGERDTVPYGFFDKAIFTEVGMFNELLERAQDYELNSRINENGGLVWFNPKIQFSYNNQASLLNFYKKQFFFEAPYNAYMWWINLSTFNIRHSITALFVLGIFFGAILSSFSALIKTAFLSVIFVYFLLSIYSSVVQAIRYSLIKHIFFLPFCFFFFHFIHGTGILYGCFNLLSKNSPVQRKNIF